MSTYTTERPIDLAQLAIELGTQEAPARLSMSDDGTERTITCHDEAVTQEALEAAVEAHVPAPPKPTESEIIANLKERLATTEKTLDQVIIDALMGDFPPTL